jgi:rhodanese-related sulfurtransferase
MTGYKHRTLEFLNIEWAGYIDRFNRWPAEYGAERVREQGYERFRDMLAHILAWWEEAMPVILAVAEGREFERKKYDFDAFNAAAVAKYKDWQEGEFLSHFETTRRKAAVDLGSMDEAAWENRRVRAWVDAVFIHHAREHLVALGRFLALDTLENEWGVYLGNFNRLEDPAAFLKKQGFDSLHDLLAHILGWWREGRRVIKGRLKDPAFTWQEHDTDAFNAELVVQYRGTADPALHASFEAERKALIELVDGLPESAFIDRDIENRLAAEVIGHFDDHAPYG